MPVVGEISRFAIEYELDADPAGAWMFGRCCYWCGGHQVGDFELGTSLRDLLFQLDERAKDGGQRHSERFAGMGAGEMLRLIDAGLFGDQTDVIAAEIVEGEQWARHKVLPDVDVFDDWKVYLVESGTSARLVFSCVPYKEVHEVELAAGEVDHVIDACRRALDDLYQRALKKPTKLEPKP